MRALRWILLLPASAAAFCAAIAASIAARHLVEQHLCPAADFDRGICNNRSLGVVLQAIQQGGAALAVIVPASLAVIIAPSCKRQVLWGALAVMLAVGAYFGFAGNAASLFVAALAGGVLAATVFLRLLRARTLVA